MSIYVIPFALYGSLLLAWRIGIPKDTDHYIILPVLMSPRLDSI